MALIKCLECGKEVFDRVGSWLVCEYIIANE